MKRDAAMFSCRAKEQVRPPRVGREVLGGVWMGKASHGLDVILQQPRAAGGEWVSVQDDPCEQIARHLHSWGR